MSGDGRTVGEFEDGEISVLFFVLLLGIDGGVVAVDGVVVTRILGQVITGTVGGCLRRIEEAGGGGLL